MVLSASIIFTLGVVHLVYTFWGPKLTPRDPALQISMSQIAPVITKETTMWRCWIGFNASHSMGLILFGLVFGFLALAHSQILFSHPSCSWSDWGCSAVWSRSARFISSAPLSGGQHFFGLLSRQH